MIPPRCVLVDPGYSDRLLETINDDALITSAYAVAGSYGCALYDGLYVALALRLGMQLITADRRLFSRVQQVPNTLWVSDWRRG
jgi:predicted nucleic acid-binding protein